jgi:hypothetical protein
MSEYYEVHNISDIRDWDNLLHYLLINGTPASSSNLQPVRELFEILRQRGCKTVIIESPYMDEDHRQCHARLHYLAQTAMSRYCKRLHFFSESIGLTDLRILTEETKQNYLGMCVWRPINSYPIGRTILAVDKIIHSPVGSNWISYPTCATDYSVHIAGQEIIINGLPYIQQDHMVSACATAAIWMAQWQMSSKYDEFIKYYSPAITEAATLYDVSAGRAIPSEGLTNRQILQSLRSLGYDPIAYELLKTQPLVVRRQLYRIIESGIPVIAGLIEIDNGVICGHAITVFGHVISPYSEVEVQTFPKNSRSTTALKYVDASDYCTAFIVNDDAAGPLRWMELYPISKITDEWLSQHNLTTSERTNIHKLLRYLKSRDVTNIAVFFKAQGQFDFLAGIDFLVAPLPRAISLPPREAQDKALAAFLVVSADYFKDTGSFDTRTFLIESENYKNHIRNVVTEGSDFTWWMTSFYLPKWIWVTEFSIHSDDVDPLKREIVASIIIDSSATRDSIDFVLMHSGGWVVPVERNQRNVIKLMDDLASEIQPILNDVDFVPYRQLER